MGDTVQVTVLTCLVWDYGTYRDVLTPGPYVVRVVALTQVTRRAMLSSMSPTWLAVCLGVCSTQGMAHSASMPWTSEGAKGGAQGYIERIKVKSSDDVILWMLHDVHNWLVDDTHLQDGLLACGVR